MILLYMNPDSQVLHECFSFKGKCCNCFESFLLIVALKCVTCCYQNLKCTMLLDCTGARTSTRGLGWVNQLPGYKFTTHYPNANYIMYKNEFQANRAQFNVIGLYKLPPRLAEPLLYAITRIFSQFHTFPHAHVCKGQTD